MGSTLLVVCLIWINVSCHIWIQSYQASKHSALFFSIQRVIVVIKVMSAWTRMTYPDDRTLELWHSWCTHSLTWRHLRLGWCTAYCQWLINLWLWRLMAASIATWQSSVVWYVSVLYFDFVVTCVDHTLSCSVHVQLSSYHA